MNDRVEGCRYPQRVRFEVFEKDLDSHRHAADCLTFHNAVVLCAQHEFLALRAAEAGWTGAGEWARLRGCK